MTGDDPGVSDRQDDRRDDRRGSEGSPGGSRESGEEFADPHEGFEGDREGFEEGRYVYCVVAGDHGDTDGDTDLPTEGVEGGDVHLLASSGVTAVVQPCDSLFDSGDPATVRRWLVQHQRVVDDAGEAFGTPLPFRFDTVLVGGDERVREWLDAHADELSAALAELSGRWEYRIDVTWEEEGLAERLAGEDDRLDELAARREAADEGRAFLVDKQYERRLDELVAARREERASEVARRLEGLADEVRRVERSASPLDEGSGDDERAVTRFSVLTDEGGAREIGEYLEALVDDPGVSVRFTGPWPPYSFAPTVGDDQ